MKKCYLVEVGALGWKGRERRGRISYGMVGRRRTSLGDGLGEAVWWLATGFVGGRRAYRGASLTAKMGYF